MNILQCIQARVSSTRLPRKAVSPLGATTVLGSVVERVRAAQLPGTIVVLATTADSDNEIVQLCDEIGVACFRGEPLDLLDRHYQAAVTFGAQFVAKIPSDCPLIDPAVIARVASQFDPAKHDYISNLHPATYPDGNDFEIFTMDALSRAWSNASRDYEREHTTPYIWEHPELFRMQNVVWETGQNYAMSHRWTLDYTEDLAFIRALYDELYEPDAPPFGIPEILDLLEARPELRGINDEYLGVNWYRNHLHELRTISSRETRMPQIRSQA